MGLTTGWLLLVPVLVLGEGPTQMPTPSTEDPYLQERLDRAIEKAKAVPRNVWGRIREARQWMWEEYPDQVLINEDTEIHWPRFLAAALDIPPWLDLGMTARLRREGFDYPFKADQKGSAWQWAHRSRFRASTRWKAFRTLVELQGSTSGQDAASDVVGISTFNAGNVQQLFVAVTLPNVLQTGLRTDLHVGRINLDVGSRRLVARSRFGNTSQAFDGIHWNLANEGLWHFRAFFSEIVLPTNTTDRLGLFTNSRHLFWGFSYETHQIPWSRIQLYYFGTDEDAENERVSRAHSTFGLRLYQPPEMEAFDYDGESAWQIGTFDGHNHFAYFQHISFGYTFRLPWAPRIMAMYDYASGTDSATGNYSQTFDGLFGARRGEFTPTGLFGPFFRSNISSPGIRVILNPRPELKLNLKFRAWYLAQSRDVWTNSGLQDPTGASGNVLGQDVEVRVQWDPYPNLSVDAGYDHFFKGSYISKQTNVPGNPPANDTDTFYMQTEVRF
ncbi:MAG TPA: alginate export family protein [Nitrospirales bacterium]|nr:alginate export family protein [Nitrospirales bacterium]